MRSGSVPHGKKRQFHSIFLLGTLGKIARLEEELKDKGNLEVNQYGLRLGRSTNEPLKIIRDSKQILPKYTDTENIRCWVLWT